MLGFESSQSPSQVSNVSPSLSVQRPQQIGLPLASVQHDPQQLPSEHRSSGAHGCAVADTFAPIQTEKNTAKHVDRSIHRRDRRFDRAAGGRLEVGVCMMSSFDPSSSVLDVSELRELPSVT